MKVAIVILPNVLKSAAYGIEELFSINNIYCKSKDEEAFIPTFISLNAIDTFNGIPLSFDSFYDVVMIPPTLKDHSYDVPKELIDWLQYQHHHGAILASACIGSFIFVKRSVEIGI